MKMYVLGIFTSWLGAARAMGPERIAQLRQETAAMFYHGFDNYMEIAFPEDEIRPVSCIPLTRDQQNHQNVALNDVLGNYSLTLIDSLSTLAILASSPPDAQETAEKSLRKFQDGVASLILHYGDGTNGTSGKGLRGRGFDIDSKVQVFETVIRGVGGLLSAHLFAVGELPILHYNPKLLEETKQKKLKKGELPAIVWPNGLNYNGQLLRLALDLAQRILPAFYTPTGIPYPRVNLRHGIPFYRNSAMYESQGFSENEEAETTETCTAGAGSLVLEFTTLSRLTHDSRFEQLAKRAFWSVWEKRSSIGLLGAGIDSENGEWIGAYSGIGAGTDSFFEYALKTYILLSGHDQFNFSKPHEEEQADLPDPNLMHEPLSVEENSSAAFLATWYEARSAVKRYLYSSVHHPHYINVHLSTGSPQAYWIDSLSAYYPGLLVLAGEVEEAIQTNLLYTALWTRYSALPERWSVHHGQVEGGLGWWPGRPEFIESNYYLYRATRDPWYLYVGEMVLKDIKERCWTKCGWSGLQDVRTGEKNDRMESFFLGETTKYLYLLFDLEHPLNSLDAGFVFTTEGHPVIIPKSNQDFGPENVKLALKSVQDDGKKMIDTCSVAPTPLPFTISVTTARRDFFHASSLIGLHLLPNHHIDEDEILALSQPTINSQANLANYTYYPWTLPRDLMPVNGFCDILPLKNTFSIEFPTTMPVLTSSTSNFVLFGSQNLHRIPEGIMVKSLSGLILGLIFESPSLHVNESPESINMWRVWNIANIPLGRDEQIFMPRGVIGEMIDPSFTRVRDPVMLDLVLQLDDPNLSPHSSADKPQSYNEGVSRKSDNESSSIDDPTEQKTIVSSLGQSFTSIPAAPTTTPTATLPLQPSYQFSPLPAIIPTGPGAAPFPDVPDAQDADPKAHDTQLLWKTVYFAGDGCNERIKDHVPKNFQILVLRRGNCSFSDKLSNIPSFAPTSGSLQLVVVVSSEDDEDNDHANDETAHESEYPGTPVHGNLAKKNRLIRPLLDKTQVTSSGLVRHNQIAMVMVGGGIETEKQLRRARSLGVKRRFHIESQGHLVGNIVVL
ncbi:BgTH12-01668 [Blumeria graminis f. sp. triticale]|nr:BgTH12-01668 [Blumeria graminis f. sp. triticale]